MTAAHPLAVTAADLAAWLDAEDAPRILDVRTPGEFDTGHIPGSYNVPLDALKEHRDELRNRVDDHVVLVCRTGGRAGTAKESLDEVGMPNVHVLDGGIEAWQAATAPVTHTPSGKWPLERQVRLVAGTLVVTGILASTRYRHAKWLSAFVGGGLTFAALTDTCGMAMLLAKLPYNKGAACDVRSALEGIARD